MRNFKRIARLWNLIRQRGWQGLYWALVRRINWSRLWDRYSEDAMILAKELDFNLAEINSSKQIHLNSPGQIELNSISWFLPDFNNPFYGGIHTILRFANHLKEKKGVRNHFVLIGNMSEERTSQKIGEAFPNLAHEPVHRISRIEKVADLDYTDAAVATLWNTAYYLLKYNKTRRKFYFIQDYEPLFYPAGSIYGQVEASYRFGFYAIANTPTIKEIYEEHYGGTAEFFYPAVDTSIFHPLEKPLQKPEAPYKIFFYGRPDHPRNGFEMGAAAFRILKKRHGEKLQIFSAGDSWDPDTLGLRGVIENLGVLPYQTTAELYRNCHAGLVMMFTRHPSYLPFEMMASGCLVVSNYNPATSWFLKDKENCLLSNISASCLADVIEQALANKSERELICQNALHNIQSNFVDWTAQMEKIYGYICEPKLQESIGKEKALYQI
jgi:O-antigen biosynthesis protein